MVLINSFLLLLFVFNANGAKQPTETLVMEQSCDAGAIVLDGNNRPGVIFQLTSNTKYRSNMNCRVTFQTALATQRIVVSVEKMAITDCPGDTLKIYDGSNLVTKDVKQQCGSPGKFSFTSTTTQITFIFTSNAAIESSGFQIALALHFPTVAKCAQALEFFSCKNNNCISKKLQCNGHDHCGDSTDEATCSLIGK